MQMVGHLRTYETAVPTWLACGGVGEPVGLDSVFRHRWVFYPGGAFDGHPVRLFAAARACHQFVYADYGMSASAFIGQCDRFRGYDAAGVHDLTSEFRAVAAQVSPLGEGQPQEVAHATLACLKRKPDADHEGSDSFAILYLGCDGFLALEALAMGGLAGSLFAILLKDHGFGGNWNRFGGGGPLEAAVSRHNIRPPLLVCADGTRCWRGYLPVEGVETSFGGMHRDERRLFGCA